MDVTTFLAQLWGPALLAIGIGFFVSPSYYVKLYRHIETETFAVFVFVIIAITAGVAQIHFHNTWNTLSEAVISFLGWGTLAKGAAFAIMPRIADKSGDWAAKMHLVPAAGGLVLIMGAYLSWIGFFA